MPPDIDLDFPTELHKRLKEISDALAELIGDALPTMAGEIKRRFAIQDDALSWQKESMTEELARAYNTNDANLKELSDRVEVLAASILETRRLFAKHIIPSLPDHPRDKPLGPNETESKQFPNPHFPH
jgi:hypothetical protein